MVGFINNLFGKKKPEERRRSSLEEMGSKSQLSEEELQDLHDISEIGGSEYISSTISALLDISDVGTTVTFGFQPSASVTIDGNGNKTRTGVSFIKLAET